jgi:hypothetical protein
VAGGLGAVAGLVMINQVVLLMMIASIDGDDLPGDMALLTAAGELFPTIEREE